MSEMEQGPAKQEQLPSTNLQDSLSMKEDEDAKMSHEEWKKLIFKAESMSSSRTQPQNQRSRIRRVSQMPWQVMHFKNYFEPRVVSIGPYHHRNPNLQLMQDLKRRIARIFFNNTCEKFDAAYEILKEKIEDLRECYGENSTREYDDEDFTRIMLEDGCFVLHFIDDSSRKDLTSQQRAFVQQDLFLLENQIPFQVLEILMKFKLELQSKSQPPQQESPHDSLMETIKDFILRCSKILTRQLDDKGVGQGPHAHLLELLWKSLVNREGTVPGSQQVQHSESPGSTSMRCFRSKRREAYSFRSVSELTAVGIQIEPSKTSSLTEISFTPSYRMIFGHLRLPQITIDDSTGPKFLNLIAYEMCPDVTTKLEVTSFICFLDSLIDRPDDVKQLRSAQVIHNLLGSDEEVATLFNEIGRDLVPDPQAYEGVKNQIQNHCESKWKRWMAVWIHEHFSTPWSGMALGAALYAIILSSYDVFQRSDCDNLCKTIRRNMSR